MATEFDGTMRFPAKPDAAFAMLSDPAYVMWKHKRMAAFDISVDVEDQGDRVVIKSSRKLPSKVPGAVKSLVGESIQIEEIHNWGPPAANGSRVAQVSATFGGAPMVIDGSMHLDPEAGGSVVKFRIVARASVPLIGGRLEAVAGEQFLRAVTKEEGIAPEWLAEQGEQD